MEYSYMTAMRTISLAFGLLVTTGAVRLWKFDTEADQEHTYKICMKFCFVKK
jgi:hypothetical protein